MANSVFSPPAVGSSGIATANIIDSAVSTAKIADNAVTEAKVAPGATLTLATMQAATSGTSKDFTGIPAGVKEIVVMFDGVAMGTSDYILVQLGDAGGLETTGYKGGCIDVETAGTGYSGSKHTDGIAASRTWYASGYVLSGKITLTLMDAATNVWTWSGATFQDDSTQDIMNVMMGSKALSETLSQIRIKSNGGASFSAGNVNIAYK